MPKHALGADRNLRPHSVLAILAILALFYTVLRIYHASAVEFNISFCHDLYKYYYQMYHYAAEQIGQGQFPLWNPWQSCGQPFMATHQCGLFYPPNIVYLLMPTHMALGTAFLLHLVLAGMFTYLCARGFGISAYGSLLAAITFMFAGHITYHIGEPSNFYCAAWTPLMLYLTKRICDSPCAKNMLLLAIFSCVQFMAGFEQHYVYTLYLMLGYVIFHFIREIRRSNAPADQVRLGAYLALAGILTIGLSAVQLIPTAEMVLLSGRSGHSLSDAQIVGLREFLSIGTGYDMTFQNFFLSLLDPSRGMFSYNYAGMLSLVLLPAAIRNGRQRGNVMYLAIMLLSCFAVAMIDWGGWTWVLRIPTVAMFRVPYRVMFVSALCFGLLAGIGWDRLVDCENALVGKTNRFLGGPLPLLILLVGLPLVWMIVWRERDGAARTLYVALAFSLLFFALRWGRTGAIRAGLLVGMVLTLFVDLSSGAFKPLVFPMRNPEVFQELDKAWEFIRENQGPYRSYFQFAHFDPKHMGIAEKYGQIKHVRAITDYEPLASQKLKDFMLLAQRRPFPEQSIFYGRFSALHPEMVRLRMLDLMSTRFFLVHRPFISDEILAPGQEAWWSSPPGTFKLVHEEPNVRVFENSSALPRAFVTHNYRVIESPEAMLKELDSATFDPMEEVLLAEAPEQHRRAMPGRLDLPETSADVAFLLDDPEDVRIRVVSERPGFLVLADSHYPGWKATVNGEPLPIHRANYMFRAVRIKEGESTVRFSYEPASFKWGLRISLISLAVTIFVCGGLLARRSRGKSFTSAPS